MSRERKPMRPYDEFVADVYATLLGEVAASASQLNIGKRTVVRRVGRLEGLFGVETRFQLGVQAAKRRLL